MNVKKFTGFCQVLKRCTEKKIGSVFCFTMYVAPKSESRIKGALRRGTRTRQHVRDNKTGRSYRRWTMPSAAICSGCLRASAPHTSESRRSWISSARAAFWRETTLSASCNRDNVTAEHFLRKVLLICVPFGTGGSVDEWLALGAEGSGFKSQPRR